MEKSRFSDSQIMAISKQAAPRFLFLLEVKGWSWKHKIIYWIR